MGATREILDEGKTEEKLVEVATNASAFLDTMHKLCQAKLEVAVACRKGCNYCCYHPVDVTFPEALVIVRTLQQRSPEEVEPVKQRCRDYIARSNPGLMILDDVQPCPLLVEGLCSVYEQRPLACRGFFSESVEPCRRGMTEPKTTTMTVPGIGVTLAAYDAVQQALSHHRLDGRRFSLPKVLLQVLEQPDLVEEYLDGKKVSE